MTEADGQRVDDERASCHMCEETFATQLELSKHLMDVHGQDGLPIEDR